jgi:hypothetical protein
VKAAAIALLIAMTMFATSCAETPCYPRLKHSRAKGETFIGMKCSLP